MFSGSTIPRVGFIARFDIPVLKFLEAMSRIAVPVVSDPVPAVVGTIRAVSPEDSVWVIKERLLAINGRSFSVIGKPFPEVLSE